MGHIDNKGKTDLHFTGMSTDFNTGKEKQKSRKELFQKRNSEAIHGTREFTTWSSEETQAFLKVAEKERHHLIFKLALNTGMRQREILGLTWEDIDLGCDVINVKGQHKQITTGKQEYVRQILISELMVNELLEHKKKQNEWKNLAGELYQGEDLVFCTNTGSVLTPGIVNREMKQIIKEAKVKEIRFSDLRYNALSEKVDLFEISSLLSAPNLTLEYYHHMASRLSRSSDDKF